MGKTVTEAIQQYLGWLQPTESEVGKRKSHKNTIEQALGELRVVLRDMAT